MAQLHPTFPPWQSGGMGGREGWGEEKDGGKGLTIHHCCQKSKVQSHLQDLLVQLIDHLKAKVNLGSSSCLSPYHSALAELAAINSHAAKGARVCSHAKWVERG